MISLLILAISLAAISYGNNAAVMQMARITRMTTATFLMDGIVNDIHAFYVRKGFPSNTLEDRECDIPNEFSKIFHCRYNLKAMELEPDVLQTLVEAGVEAFVTAQEAGTDDSFHPPDHNLLDEIARDPASAVKRVEPDKASSLDLSTLAQLAPLFGPQGQELTGLCNINIAGVLLSLQGTLQFLPQIVDMVAKRTRLLEVKLSWNEGFRKSRELKIQTFVVSLPEEEIEAMKEMERAQELHEAVDADMTVPSSAPPSTEPSQLSKPQAGGS